MSLEKIENLLREKLAYAPQIGAVLKCDFGDNGILVLDGNQAPPVISSEDRDDVDTTFQCSVETLENISNGTQDPTMAFMTGKLKVQGSMGYALKLASLLED